MSQSPSNRALSKLRVARAALLGVERCLTDAARRLRAGEVEGLPAMAECLAEGGIFAERGKAKVEDATAAVVEALKAAGVPPKRARRGRQPRQLPEGADPKRASRS